MAFDAPYLTTPQGRETMRTVYLQGLLHDTLPFWFPNCLDEQYGGYLHYRDGDGSLIDDDKSIWAQGRMSWMLLTLYNQWEQRAEWLSWAESGLEFLRRFGFDSDGRMFFQVTRQGRPLRKRRYAYSECFAAIAFAAHYRATQSPDSKRMAESLFSQFVDWNFTPGMMPPKFTDERPMMSLGPRIMTLVTAQELRLNLGASELLDAWGTRCLEEIARFFMKPEVEAVMELVGVDGEILEHVDGRTLNPGHAIEGAWFVMWEGKLRGDARWVELGCRMLDWMWKRGWDDEYGGLFYFRDLRGKPVQEYWHDMKFWWPHNEAIIATALAYSLTHDGKYASWHQQVHDWSYQHFADPIHGEWFGYLHRDGSRSTTTKGNLWKSCFHFPRMQWMGYTIVSSWLDPLDR